jgi:hypothetical protein
VGRQEHGRALGAVDLLEKLADVRLRDDVEADRRLVEEEERRPVQQRRREVAPHALAERELAHRLMEIRLDPEDAVEARHPLGVFRVGNPVDLLQQLERLDDRDVPPELGALAEDDSDRSHVFRAVPVRNVTVADDLSGRRGQDAGQHLDRRGLAGAVRTDVPDHLAGFDRKRHVRDGGDLSGHPPDEGLQRRGQTLFPAICPEDLREPRDSNERLAHRLDPPPISTARA